MSEAIRTAALRGTIGPHLSDWQGGQARAAVVRRGMQLLFFTLGAVFGLLGSAYLIRMRYFDWQPLALPLAQLGWSTACLVLASVGLEVARRLRMGPAARVRRVLLVAAVPSVLFLGSQWQLWQQLQAAGYTLADNPANSFFYLMTGLHALHVLVGVLIWAWVALRLLWRREVDPSTAVAVCALYWHFLLVVWLVLLGLLLAT